MKVSMMIKIIILVFVLAIASVSILIYSFIQERGTLDAQRVLEQAGRQLIAASDLLTNSAREYVQYGDKKFYDIYMKEANTDQNVQKAVEILEKYNREDASLDLSRPLELVRKASELSAELELLEQKAFEAVEGGKLDEARQLMFGEEYAKGSEPIAETVEEFQSSLSAIVQEEVDDSRTLSTTLVFITAVLMIAMLVVTLLCMISINKKLKSISVLADKATEISLGHVDLKIDASSSDEVGVLAKAFVNMLGGIREQSSILDKMSDGDFRNNIPLRSDSDAINISLNRLIDSYNDTMSEIAGATEQVSMGANQIADSSQNLAIGSTTQAEAVERLSDAIEQVSKRTIENSERANTAARLADTIKENAEKGNTQMEHMMNAVKDINDASESIGKVIKVIDDIAFQTNILALNAAVEAARAGQHGKGFAVVAEEVRSLAAKSADAAKDTSSLIANSMEKAEYGSKIAKDTAASLSEIVAGINESTQIVREIALSSDEQANAVTQISKGIEQVAEVVQQNSATAEESAATAEEMSGQSVTLNSMVARFQLKNLALGSPLPRQNRQNLLSPPSEESYGKY